MNPKHHEQPLSRRQFLRYSAGGALGTALAAQLGPAAFADAAHGCVLGPVSAAQRAADAYFMRVNAALMEKDRPLPLMRCNEDEALYPERFSCFTKTLPHDDAGNVSGEAYEALLLALRSGKSEDFEAIPQGGAAKLANPQAAYAYELGGPDGHQLDLAPAPAFASAQTAGEMVELYWHALLRDVAFADYESDARVTQAAVELSTLSDFRGPKVNGRVTAQTLFRGNTPGDAGGPYISQFLWLPIPYGAQTMDQRIRTPLAGDDHLTEYASWLAVQNGNVSGNNHYDETRRYIRNGRDLGEWVHQDFPFEGYLNAALILSGMKAPPNRGNPYRALRRQGAFVTFGPVHLLAMIASATQCSMKATWCHKWLVHRRLRPEAFGARVHQHRTEQRGYPVHDDLLQSQALEQTLRQQRSYLLSQAYAEGAPAHPAYPAGHAAIAGACVTVLKAFYDESFVIPNTVVASTDGLSLEPYSGPALTVGGELNKLAANIALARDFAGVHYRSDGIEGLKLGEAAALAALEESRLTCTEPFEGFTLTTFDGDTVTV